MLELPHKQPNTLKKSIKYLTIILFIPNINIAQSIYAGGSSDGSATDCYAQADNIALNIYSGGNSDGFATDCYAQADNPSFDIYNGGNSDGFSVNCYAQADNPSFDIYNGGNSDGFSIDCYAQADNVFYDIYNGGNGDGFALFCLGTISEEPLPIELIKFIARLNENQSVLLSWQTLTEINNDYFTIERSRDVTAWQEVEKIDGAGNSNTLLQYHTIDEHPYLNISYYRLKQTDFNGQYSYSEAVPINIVPLGKLNIYPNPTTEKITIEGSKLELSSLKIYNLLGQDVSSSVDMIQKNEKIVVMSLVNLPAGVYTIKTKTTANKIHKK